MIDSAYDVCAQCECKKPKHILYGVKVLLVFGNIEHQRGRVLVCPACMRAIIERYHDDQMRLWRKIRWLRERTGMTRQELRMKEPV